MYFLNKIYIKHFFISITYIFFVKIVNYIILILISLLNYQNKYNFLYNLITSLLSVPKLNSYIHFLVINVF